jgi:curved DNA-binding protein CbpA
MESCNTTFLDHYLQSVKDEASHIIECKSGKKKWLFYFVNGALALTKSNLKGEQNEALKESHPDVSSASLPLLQAQIRVLKAFTAEEWNLKSSSKTPSGSVPTMDAILNGFASFLEENDDVLAEIKSGMEQLRPKLMSPLDSIQSDVQNFMATMKGNLRSPVTVSNSSVSEELGWATLWILQEMELFEVDENAQEKLSDLLDFNLDEILAEEVAKEDEIIEESESEESDEVEDIQETEAESVSEPEVVSTAVSTEQMNSLDELESHINTSTNHFEILGVSRTGTSEDFRKAFFELSKKLHPDRYHTASDEVKDRATALFDSVREAHEVLSNDDERQKYIDVVIFGKASDEEAAMEQYRMMMQAEEAFKKGERLFQQGQSGRAHNFFQEAHTCDPNTLEFKAYFGYTTFSQNKGSDQTKAQEGIDMIVEVTKANEEQEVKLDSAWVLLARAHRENGNKDKALRAIKKALKIKPSNSDAQRELKRIRGQEPGAQKGKKAEKKGGFWSKLFGGK